MPPKRRGHYRGLYYHSSPPKVLQMNGNATEIGRGEKAKDAFVVKASNIRIWIHDKDIAKLTKVLWAGQGNRLRSEISNNPRVRRFLETVPNVLNSIREVHKAVVENDLEVLQLLMTPRSVPRSLITTKDQNGLTVMHKAAGLGHTMIVEYLVQIWPDGVNDCDATGKTPLHWAASVKNNTRCYNLLVQAGADEEAFDYKMRLPNYYRQRPGEVDKSLLTVLPDAPRVAQDSYPEWSALIDEPDFESYYSGSGNNKYDSRGSDITGDRFSRSRDISFDNTSEPDTDDREGKLIAEAALQAALDTDNNNKEDDVNAESEIAENEIIEHEADTNGDIDINDDGENGNDVHSREASPLLEDPMEEKNVEEPAAAEMEDDVTGSHISTLEESEIVNSTEPEKTVDDDMSVSKVGTEEDQQNQSGDECDCAEGEIEKTELPNLFENPEQQQSEGQTIPGEDIESSNNNTSPRQQIESQNQTIDENDAKVDEVEKENHETEEENQEEEGNNKTNEEEEDNSKVEEQKNEGEEEKLKEDEEKYKEFNEKHEGEEKGEEREEEKQKEGEEENTNNIEENFENAIEIATNGKLTSSGDGDETEKEINKIEDFQNVDSEQDEKEKGENKSNIEENFESEIENETNGTLTSSEDDDETKKVIHFDFLNVDSGHEIGDHHEDVKIEDNEKQNYSEIDHENSPNDSEKGEESSEEFEDDTSINLISHDENSNSENNEHVKDSSPTEIGNGINQNIQNEEERRTPITREKTFINNFENEKNMINSQNFATDDEDDDDQDNEAEPTSDEPVETSDDIIIEHQPTGSPSPALEIQGIVQGEPDDNQVQSEGGLITDNADNVQAIVAAGDMEQLAALVLNGEGKKLLGAHSTQPEIQAFLENVKAYMNKIRRVHQAARNGSLRELQAALDRRKFAIAKDEISPNGASPLHVATIFGHTGVVRYLAGRFPETTSTVDDNGRTALHYAAAINDNGHFYNLLTHLGSNPKATDKLGNTADFYRNQEVSMGVLSHKKLLQDFGADENLEEQMLSDQVPDDLHSARRYLDDADILSTLERCFRLIQEQPKTADTATSTAHGSASSVRITVTSYLNKFLKRSVFDKIKHRLTRLDHNLFDIIWPAMKKSSMERSFDEDYNGGVVAPDFDIFVVFQEFFVPLIKDMHCMNLSQDFKPHPRMFYFPLVDGKLKTEMNFEIDESSKYILHSFVECCRNLDDFELPLNLNIGQIEQAERLIIEKILSLEFVNAIQETEPGVYYTLNEIMENASEVRAILATSKLLIPLLDYTDPNQEAESIALNGLHWPYGRGVFVSSKRDLAAWINVQEHLRIIVSSPSDSPADLGYAFSKAGRAIMYLNENLHFRESYLLGYLTSRPSFLGTALKISTIMELPHLVKEIENLRHLCLVRGLHMIPNRHDGTVRLINMQSLGITEWRLFQDYCTAVTNILQLEKDMSLTNSQQIAAMLVKIFRRKKNSFAEN